MSEKGAGYDLVGTKEAASIVGVLAPNFVRDWASRSDFPEPVVLGGRRLWERAAIEAYDRRVGRRRAARMADLRLSPDAARWLPIMKRRIVRRFHPQRIVMFGSQARGEATSDSDLDLLVVVPDEADTRDLVPSIRAALADVAVSKDVFVATPAQIARYGDVIGTLLESALGEGVTIYARP